MYDTSFLHPTRALPHSALVRWTEMFGASDFGCCCGRLSAARLRALTQFEFLSRHARGDRALQLSVFDVLHARAAVFVDYNPWADGPTTSSEISSWASTPTA